MFYPNTSPCFTLKHPDVLDTQSYGVYSLSPYLFHAKSRHLILWDFDTYCLQRGSTRYFIPNDRI